MGITHLHTMKVEYPGEGKMKEKGDLSDENK